MMTEQSMRIVQNERIARDVFKMVLAGDTGSLTAPGQFVQVALPGRYLRRPLSVCDWDESSLTLIYKVVGEGTRDMAGMGEGTLSLLTGLGNGFDMAVPMKQPLLIGGGVGVPPLYGLAKRLVAMGLPVRAVIGFQAKEDVFYERELAALGCKVTVATTDGNYGVKGFVTDAIRPLAGQYDYYFTCGPEPMLRAVHALCGTDGQLSFEERMACGFGACMGCTCMTLTGAKRICKEGPVLRKEEVLWRTQP